MVSVNQTEFRRFYLNTFLHPSQAKILVPNSINNERMEMIRICLDRILDEQVFPHSGNVKSSVGSDQDRLVHWCHGAPGAVHLYALASQVSWHCKVLFFF